MITEERKKELSSNIDNIEEHYCPGGPNAGCCEFCKGPCYTISLHGVTLSENETDYILELLTERIK